MAYYLRKAAIVCIFLAGVDCELDGGRNADFSNINPVSDHRHRNDRLDLRHWQTTRHDNRTGHESRNAYDSRSEEPRRLVGAELQRKVYAPKQDPRDYYRSVEYARSLAELGSEGERRTSSVYPQLEAHLAAFRAHEGARYRFANSITEDDDIRTLCVRCPTVRSLTLRPYEESAPLPSPLLYACGGARARGARFVPYRGPRPGDALRPGRHVVIGGIFYKGHHLQTCRYRVDVVRACATPRGLLARCDTRDTRNARCTFACADPDTKLVGSAALHCADGRWSGLLPVCRARECSLPPAPADGRVSCRRTPGRQSSRRRLSHGSRCRVRCRSGLTPVPPTGALCQHGAWTAALACVNDTNLYDLRLLTNESRSPKLHWENNV